MRAKTCNSNWIALFAVLVSLLALAACGPTAPAASPTVGSDAADQIDQTAPEAGALPTAALSETGGEAYPGPAAVVESTNPYPGEGDAALPATTVPEAYPPVEEPFQEPRFRIDQPVSASASAVTGQAPPDTAIVVIDVSYNGATLGTGRSDANGRFAIPVTGLVEGNRIGLGVGELVAGQTIEQMAEFYFPYRGEGFMNLPNVGIFFDTTTVVP